MYIDSLRKEERLTEMRLFNFLECCNTTTNIQIFDVTDNKILYEGKIGDITHKICRMRNIVLGTAEIKNEILMVQTRRYDNMLLEEAETE